MIKSSFKKKLLKNKKSLKANKNIINKFKPLKIVKNRFKQNKKDFKTISNSNIILLNLENFFYILYKSSGSINQILKKLNLAKDYEQNLKFFLEHIQQFNILKISAQNYKLNNKFIKDTKIPKYFLLKVNGVNSLNEQIATLPDYITSVKKYTIVIDKKHTSLQQNDYFLAKLNKINDKILTATVLEVFPRYTPDNVIGLINFNGKKPFIVPLSRKYKSTFEVVNYKNYKNLNNNALVKAEIIGSVAKNYPKATIINIICNEDVTNNLSLLTAYEFNLAINFSEEVLKAANTIAGLPTNLDNYKDLRDLPLVTIDGEDAKDFDDAVYVTQISTTPLKYKAIVAIADVSSYVKNNSLLDEEAKKRGNSTYLPGLVIPMLPPILSNEWCSLKPNLDRAALVVELIINNKGLIESYNFYKAIINSKARLTYNEVEQSINDNFGSNTNPMLKNIILPLYNCWKLLNKAKISRNSLDIQSNEYKVNFNSDNTVKDIEKKENLTANKIIEEFMIAANVAAAQFLKKCRLKDYIIYRVHDKPNNIKLENLNVTLNALSIKTKIPTQITTVFFNELLYKYKNTEIESILNESILATQSQAQYSTNNIGHFGLALKEYCHFTSPIRRYSDLVIHRLITAAINKEQLNLNTAYLNELSSNLTTTEKHSASAEYSAIEKIMAKLLESKINCTFNSTIVNITNAGLFIALDCMGAQGLVPMRTLGNERFIFSNDKSKLIGVNTKKVYKIRDNVVVKLKESNVLKGLLTFIPA